MKKLRKTLLTVATIFSIGATTTVATIAGSQQTADAAYYTKGAKFPAAANYSRRFVGTRYIWGGTTPRGFDCSGFVQYVFRNSVHVNLPRTSQQQANSVRRISVREAKPGDLLFWQSRGNVYHVAISLGNGNYISALRPGLGVQINRMSQPAFAGRVY